MGNSFFAGPCRHFGLARGSRRCPRRRSLRYRSRQQTRLRARRPGRSLDADGRRRCSGRALAVGAEKPRAGPSGGDRARPRRNAVRDGQRLRHGGRPGSDHPHRAAETPVEGPVRGPLEGRRRPLGLRPRRPAPGDEGRGDGRDARVVRVRRGAPRGSRCARERSDRAVVRWRPRGHHRALRADDARLDRRGRPGLADRVGSGPRRRDRRGVGRPGVQLRPAAEEARRRARSGARLRLRRRRSSPSRHRSVRGAEGPDDPRSRGGVGRHRGGARDPVRREPAPGGTGLPHGPPRGGRGHAGGHLGARLLRVGRRRAPPAGELSGRLRAHGAPGGGCPVRREGPGGGAGHRGDGRGGGPTAGLDDRHRRGLVQRPRRPGGRPLCRRDRPGLPAGDDAGGRRDPADLDADHEPGCRADDPGPALGDPCHDDHHGPRGSLRAAHQPDRADRARDHAGGLGSRAGSERGDVLSGAYVDGLAGPARPGLPAPDVRVRL